MEQSALLGGAADNRGGIFTRTRPRGLDAAAGTAPSQQSTTTTRDPAGVLAVGGYRSERDDDGAEFDDAVGTVSDDNGDHARRRHLLLEMRDSGAWRGGGVEPCRRLVTD